MSDWDNDAAYRAIGRYVVTFSQLVSVMRDLIAERISGGATGSALGLLVLGAAPAGQIADAFFGLCRAVGDFDEHENRVTKSLAKWVGDAITTRNDFAHGDWGLGDVMLQDGRHVELPPRLLRIYPGRKSAGFVVTHYTSDQINALSGHMERLLAFVEDYGKLALGLPVLRTTTDEEGAVSKGEVRVRDIITAGNNTLARNGPLAPTVNVGLHAALTEVAGEPLGPAPVRQ